jgi:glycosyltransferase involved in cell wall biosynthesis
VLVDDGSRDKTFDIILEMTKAYSETSSSGGIIVRGISQVNLGKGGAVKRGMLYSRG